MRSARVRRAAPNRALRVGCASSAKGEREHLPAIDADRCALVIVDVQKDERARRPQDHYGEIYKQIYSERTKAMQERILPNMSGCSHSFVSTTFSSCIRRSDPIKCCLTLRPNPRGTEVVVAKYSSGAFSTSPMDNVLREHDIATLFFRARQRMAAWTRPCGRV